METTIICPVDHVIHECQGDLQPVIDFIAGNQPLPATDRPFPVGTVTADGRLDLCKQKLGVQGMTLIAAALQQNHVIKHVLLGTNAFGNPGAMELAKVLRVNTTIETIYLGCNYMESTGCIALCEALEQNTTVRSIWFKRNPIGAESIPAIIRLLQKNRHIRTLDLVNTCVGEALHELLHYLGNNDTLERLYLSGNRLTASTMAHVNQMLLQNDHLKGLFLSVNNFGDEGVKALLPALSANKTLQEISFASCGVSDEGVQLLCQALSNNPNLVMLDLGYAPSTRVLGAAANQLSAKGVAAIMQLTYLQSLNLTRTNLSADLKALLSAQETIPHVVMDGLPKKGEMLIHPDSKAIKSVYR